MFAIFLLDCLDMVVLKKSLKRCLAPKNTPSKLCNVASNLNLLRMECTIIIISKVGAAQDSSWKV